MRNNLPIEHSPERETDVQKLCLAILEASPNWWDNPNGAYESTCPFCYAIEHRGSIDSTPPISEIKHKLDCAYFIAKDLSTNIL